METTTTTPDSRIIKDKIKLFWRDKREKIFQLNGCLLRYVQLRRAVLEPGFGDGAQFQSKHAAKSPVSRQIQKIMSLWVRLEFCGCAVS